MPLCVLKALVIIIVIKIWETQYVSVKDWDTLIEQSARLTLDMLIIFDGE